MEKLGNRTSVFFRDRDVGLRPLYKEGEQEEGEGVCDVRLSSAPPSKSRATGLRCEIEGGRRARRKAETSKQGRREEGKEEKDRTRKLTDEGRVKHKWRGVRGGLVFCMH